jgi:hypothetical protein
MMGTSRLAHLGVSGPFSSLGPVSNHGKVLYNNKNVYCVYALTCFCIFQRAKAYK